MAKRAKGILVSLGIVKAGFLVGAQYGSGGALFKNGRTAGYYNIIAGSYGLQAGVGPSVVVVDKGVAKSLTTTTAKSGEHAFNLRSERFDGWIGAARLENQPYLSGLKPLRRMAFVTPVLNVLETICSRKRCGGGEHPPSWEVHNIAMINEENMNKVNYKIFSLITSVLCFAALLPTMAQGEVMVYPMQSQSNEQLSKDRYECHMWAVQQSGFDPSTAQTSQTSPQTQPKGEVLRGGARGAAAGAAIGAIAGDAGKGAAIGATAGGLKRGFERRDQKRAAQGQTAAPMPGQDAYDRAIKACLSGRNYSVN